MENLRWILLLAGIIFIIVVYLISRQRRRSDAESYIEPQDDVPDFSATDDLDAVDEGVGTVKIIASFDDDAAVDEISEQRDEASVGTEQAETAAAAQSDIIMLCILSASNDEKLGGDQINSAARASGLVFGDMEIFHRLDDDDQILFSMANMLKPGSFDPENMYELETTGVSIFMQASLLANPSDVLDDMLQTAYQMAEMLGGRLCNHQRNKLTEQDANQYRQQVANITAKQ
jgi:cell division protein ZipA